MNSLGSRLWNTSPASLTRALTRRLKKLQSREAWQRVSAGPATGVQLLLTVPLDRWGGDMVQGSFDRFLYDTIARHRSVAGARCWDIGANIGYHSLALATLGAQVLAFEPAKANVERLKLHLEKNPAPAERIRIIAAAVADQDGELAFEESSDLTSASSGSHLTVAMPPLRPAVYANFRHSVVPAVTMDTLIENRGELPPDIIKIDVEGAEHLVLAGGRRSLARHKPLLLVEVHHICVMLSLAETLIQLGYRIEVLDRENATPSRCFILAK